jgi:WD40 repeat protein
MITKKLHLLLLILVKGILNENKNNPISFFLQDPVCSLTQYNNHLYSSSNKCLKVWDIQTLELINETQTDSRNGWLRILMPKDKCIYAGCRRVIKVFDSVTHQISFEFELPINDSIYSLAHSDTLLFAGSLSGAIYVSYQKNKSIDRFFPLD